MGHDRHQTTLPAVRNDRLNRRSVIQPAFLNLMALVAERGGKVNCRFGGNTQDYAVVVPSLPDNKAIEKDKTDSTNPVRICVCLTTMLAIYLTFKMFKPLDGHTDSVPYPRNDISAQQCICPC